MEIIPTGNTSLNELTEKYVRKQYGEEAVSELEANITTVEKEAAGQAIDSAIMADKLHPYVKPPDGVEQRLTKDGWDLPLPGENYDDNVDDLIGRLKRGSYKAKLVKRKRIPKSPGKTRPLGLPVLEDKLLQTVGADLLCVRRIRKPRAQGHLVVQTC